MGYIQVTASELRNKAEELRNLNSNFSTQTESLKTTEEALKTMWEGEANTSFHNAFIRDKGQMDSFKQAIDTYINALVTIAGKYEEAEARNAAVASARSY
ncbi:MAG: WXG100 family type VII secretion target [Lachnospiraceae bacterium]|nr:WXG100 family type VII secretion target [Lachnospiraceae bacterium]MBR2275266.1 WXG100 family type VII secretion target [Lachnospiraceae bacterium]